MGPSFNGINRLPEAAAAIEKAVDQSIRKAALDCEARAKAACPVDTGFLKSSIYSELHDSSTYGNADEPPDGAELLPEIEKPKDAHTAYVAVGASYGVFVEMGTVHAAAQPYLTPAADAVRPGLMAALDKLEEKMIALGLAPMGL